MKSIMNELKESYNDLDRYKELKESLSWCIQNSVLIGFSDNKFCLSTNKIIVMNYNFKIAVSILRILLGLTKLRNII